MIGKDMNTILSTLIFLVFLGTPNPTYSHVEYDSKKERFNILVRTTNDTLELYELTNKSWAFRNTNLDSAFYYSDLGLELLNKISHKKLESELLDNRSSLHQMKGNLDSAELYQYKSLIIRIEENDYNGLLSSYKSRGKYNSALIYYSKALNAIDSIRLETKEGLIKHYKLISNLKALVEETKILNNKKKIRDGYINNANYLSFNSFRNDTELDEDTEKGSPSYMVMIPLFLVFILVIVHFYKSK